MPAPHQNIPSMDELKQLSIENASISILWLTETGEIIYANKMAARSLGYSQNEMLDLTMHDIDPDYSPEKWRRLREEADQSVTISIESLHKTKQGRLFPVEIIVNYLDMNETEISCVFIHDISEQKEIREKLKQSEERFRLTLEATSHGMWDRNFEDDKTFYGSNWASSLGYSDDDVEKGTITWQGLLHPDDKEHTLQALHDHFDGKTDHYTAEFRLLNSKGAWQWTLARGKVVERDSNSKPLRFIGIHTNISKRKEAERQLQENAKKVRLFAYSVAHDLKNPAMAIRGLTKKLCSRQNALPFSKLKEYLNRIYVSSEHIIDLIDQLNLFVTAKEIPLQLEAVRLESVLESLYSEFADQLWENKISFHFSDQYPPITCDRAAITRVLRNFIDNAIKYGGEGLSAISVSYEERPNHHVIRVKDNGIGLSREDTISVFSPFERKSSSRGIRGTGLGLAIVKEVALQHHGSVWAEKTGERGISFFFSISRNL